MEVPGEAEFEAPGNMGLNLGHALGVELGLVGKAVAGVRGTRDGGDAFGDRLLGQGEGGFEIGCAVVDAVDEVVMDIDHASGTLFTHRRFRLNLVSISTRGEGLQHGSKNLIPIG